jgi:hypothetical protein
LGWLGFDPTIGDIVGADQFPVAVAHLPQFLMSALSRYCPGL